MSREEDRKEKYRQEIEMFKPVTINDMVCKDCIFRYPEVNRVTKCHEYPKGKPSSVIYGGKCTKYSKE